MRNKTGKSERKLPESFFKQMIEHERIHRDSKYGEFIIQTNNVQRFLTVLIVLKAPLPDKKLKKYLEKITFGNLINCFRICANNSRESSLINSLELYNNSRNALAHKMYTKKKLTEKECELSIELGEEILKELKILLKSLWPIKSNL